MATFIQEGIDLKLINVIVGTVAGQIKVEPPPVVRNISNTDGIIVCEWPANRLINTLTQEPPSVANLWFNRTIIEKAPFDNIYHLPDLAGAEKGQILALTLCGIVFVEITSRTALLTNKIAIAIAQQDPIWTIGCR